METPTRFPAGRQAKQVRAALLSVWRELQKSALDPSGERHVATIFILVLVTSNVEGKGLFVVSKSSNQQGAMKIKELTLPCQ